PDVAAAVKRGLADAEAQPSLAQRAFTLRGVLDQVRQAVNPKLGTLWARLGGEPAVKAVVHDFVGVAATDPKVNFFRNGKYKLDDAGVANLEKLLVELISAVTGGPLKYEGRPMKEVHAGMKITSAEFDASAADLAGVLKKY